MEQKKYVSFFTTKIFDIDSDFRTELVLDYSALSSRMVNTYSSCNLSDLFLKNENSNEKGDDFL